VLWSTDDYDIDPILAAVGQLQFEVVASRLQTEYGIETKYETMPYEVPPVLICLWGGYD